MTMLRVAWALAGLAWLAGMFLVVALVAAVADRRTLRLAVARLNQQLSQEAYGHAACLSIAEGHTGWKSFEPEWPAGAAVMELRVRLEALEDAVKAADPRTRQAIGLQAKRLADRARRGLLGRHLLAGVGPHRGA